VPIEPPTCWEVLTIAEATPASVGLTPSVAVPNPAEKIDPIASPTRIRPGRTSATYVLDGVNRVKNHIAMQPITIPKITTARGPVRGRIRVCAVVEVATIVT